MKGDLSLESEGFLLAVQEHIPELLVMYKLQALPHYAGYVQSILRWWNIWCGIWLYINDYIAIAIRLDMTKQLHGYLHWLPCTKYELECNTVW